MVAIAQIRIAVIFYLLCLSATLHGCQCFRFLRVSASDRRGWTLKDVICGWKSLSAAAFGRTAVNALEHPSEIIVVGKADTLRNLRDGKRGRFQ